MTKRFSRNFETFDEWNAQAGDSPYARRIRAGHVRRPKASLSQLRRHPSEGERPLSDVIKTQVSKLPWDFLAPREMRLRDRSLGVISEMRNKGYSLSRAAKKSHISPETVLKHAGALKKKGSRWKPKRHDTTSRIMQINEKGKVVWIDVKDSRVASKIGRYHSAVGRYLETGDKALLETFKGVQVRDASGNLHTLETSPKALHEIRERRAHEEFYTIYQED